MWRLSFALLVALTIHGTILLMPLPEREQPQFINNTGSTSITVQLRSLPMRTPKSRPVSTAVSPPKVEERKRADKKIVPEKKNIVVKRSATIKNPTPKRAPQVVPVSPDPPFAAAPKSAQAAKSVDSATQQQPAKPSSGEGTEVVVKAVPVYADNPKPPYPNLARKRGWQGTVVLAVLVSAGGDVAQAAIQNSSGYELLDKIALKTVRRWRFLPGTMGGVVREMEVLVPVHFRLQ